MNPDRYCRDAPKMSTNKDKKVEKAVEKFFGDITKASATQQIIVGAASGW